MSMRAIVLAPVVSHVWAGTCCWSRWGDASTCGNYPQGGSGPICGNDGVTHCQNNADCSGPPTPGPSPTPTPSPVPTPSPAPGPAYGCTGCEGVCDATGPSGAGSVPKLNQSVCQETCTSGAWINWPCGYEEWAKSLDYCFCRSSSPTPPAPTPPPTPPPSPPSPSPGPGLLWQGSIIQPWLSSSWTNSNFATEFSYMRQVRMNHLIWQWTVDNTPSKRGAFYPTKLPGITQTNVGADPIKASLVEGANNGIEIWLGLANNDDWFQKFTSDADWLNAQFSLCKDVASELWDQYGPEHGGTIAGFYMPFEVENLHFQDAMSRKLMGDALADLADYVHATLGKKLMWAPFYNTAIGSAGDFAELLGNLTAAAGMDVVAVQDGVGAQHATVTDIPVWFKAMRTAVKAARPKTEFWVDLETFGAGFAPAQVSRVVDQLQAVAPFVDGVTTFSFNHYDSPQQGHTEQFKDWAAFVNATVLEADLSTAMI